MTYFVDTSALAKRYVSEIGSAWLVSWDVASAGNIIVISELTLVEMYSVFARRIREGTLSPYRANILRNNFLLHVKNEYLVVAIEGSLLI